MKYKWWTCGADRIPCGGYGGGGALKLGPATLVLCRWFPDDWCFELHWMNQLKLAIPDWRKP